MRKEKFFSELSIDGTSALIEIRTTCLTNYNCIVSSSTEKRIFPLIEISKDDIFNLRRVGEPGFVLKKQNHLFYAAITKDLRFFSQNMSKPHFCSYCKHCRATSEEQGGCSKVRDRCIEYYKNKFSHIFYSDEQDSVKMLLKSKRLEKYSFIRDGFESFNTDADSFVVQWCSHYCADKKHKVKRRTNAEILNDQKLAHSYC